MRGRNLGPVAVRVERRRDDAVPERRFSAAVRRYECRDLQRMVKAAVPRSGLRARGLDVEVPLLPSGHY